MNQVRRKRCDAISLVGIRVKLIGGFQHNTVTVQFRTEVGMSESRTLNVAGQA